MTFVSDRISREQLGMADGSMDVDGFAVAQPPVQRSFLLETSLRAYLPVPVHVILQLIIAHDGSLAEALSRAIVARANEIGLAVLVDHSPKGEMK